MNLKRKITLGILSTGLLISPLGNIHNQANAETQNYNSKILNEAAAGDTVTFDYSADGHQVKQIKTLTFQQDDETYMTSKPVSLKQAVVDKDGEVDEAETYQFKIKGHVIASGEDGSPNIIEVTKNDIEYVSE